MAAATQSTEWAWDRTSLDERVRAAVLTFQREGYLIVPDVLPLDFVAELRREYMHALDAKRARLAIQPAAGDERLLKNDRVGKSFTPIGANHDLNRWNMHLPSRRPFLDSRLVADPFVSAVLAKLMGDDYVLVGLYSDTPYPNSGYQNIHQDDTLLRVTLNVPLVDFTEENGPTEVWPRTHRADPERADGAYTSGPYPVGRAEMERRAKLPSLRVITKAGAVVLRDHRLMHRGTPNRTSEPRPMLTLNYAPAPKRIPHARLMNAVAKVALRLREEGRRATGARAKERTSGGQTLNRVNEYSCGTDRDYRRVIPADVWNGLDARAQSVLRYALVSGVCNAARKGAKSTRATLRLLAIATKTYVTMRLAERRG